MRALIGACVSVLGLGCDTLLGLDHVTSPNIVCLADDTCVRGTDQGRCECGVCSYRDASCPGSNRRWSSSASNALSNVCVPIPESIDSTVNHTCLVMTDTTAWCWGWNSDGQLGAGQPIGVSSTFPIQVRTTSGDVVDGIVEIGAGSFHTCGLRSDGTVACWGSNWFGQLGAALPMGQGTLSVDPVTVQTAAGVLTGVTRLAVGFNFACARVENDTLYCWGANGRAQLGDASLADSAIAIPVVLPAGAVGEPAAGGEHACVVIDTAASSKDTYCWGRTGNGRLGNNVMLPTDGHTAVPQRVYWNATAPLPDAHELHAHNRHTCAIKRPPGELHCWGANEGRLGDGTTPDRSIATLVVGGSSTSTLGIAPGDHHTCALIGNETRCWGLDTEGQIGDGPADANIELVPKVAGADSQLAITSGFEHSCTLGMDERLRCWGGNNEGQLGVGDTVVRHEPTEIVSSDLCVR